jgi:hypothetical protein
MDKEAARDYLSFLLNKNLRITVTDGRMFRGSFKCTDPVIGLVSRCSASLCSDSPALLRILHPLFFPLSYVLSLLIGIMANRT